ncbi:MAG: ATP-binding protein [Bacteroidales bacterium]
MLLESEIEAVLESQKNKYQDVKDLITRLIFNQLRFDTGFVLIITGVRRCGKSTFARQLLSRNHIKGSFLNLEDPRLDGFDLQDFVKLDRIQSQMDKTYFRVFDEIQNVHDWEKYIRSGQESGFNYLLTGSNATMLSQELGTRLTGRHLSYEMFPFSFNEYLVFTGQVPGKSGLEGYLNDGGFPEYLRYYEPEILNRLLDDILYRDITARHGIKHHEQLRQLAIFLISNAGKPVTYNSLGKQFGFGSPNTVLDYMAHLEESYLIFQVFKFDYSLKNRLKNPRKVYTIDPGFATANSLSFSADTGRKLENTVFLNLRRKYKEIYYFADKGECDFVVRKPDGTTEAIQVCTQLDPDNLKRETTGLIEALNFFNLSEGTILTLDQEDLLDLSGKHIWLIPAWKWLD